MQKKVNKGGIITMVKNMGILAQFFRIISAVFEIMADRESQRKKIFLYNGIYNAFCALQYFLLNAITGGICSILAILRNFLMFYCEKKYLFFILPIYFISLILINFGSFDGIISFLPIIMVVLYTMSLFLGNIYGIKCTIIFVMILEIIYDIYYGAYVGVGVSIIDIIFVIISFFDIKNKEIQ